LVHLVTSRPPTWAIPPEYGVTNVADTVARIILGYRLPDRAEEAYRARHGG
jgi:hypothetical protein